MAVPESKETTEDTSDSADELYTPVAVEDVEFESPRKKKVMKDKSSNASSSMHCKMFSRSRISQSNAMYWCIIRSALSRAFFDTDNIYCNDIFQTYSCFSTALL
jgi:hypothetical protein